MRDEEELRRKGFCLPNEDFEDTFASVGWGASGHVSVVNIVYTYQNRSRRNQPMGFRCVQIFHRFDHIGCSHLVQAQRTCDEPQPKLFVNLHTSGVHRIFHSSRTSVSRFVLPATHHRNVDPQPHADLCISIQRSVPWRETFISTVTWDRALTLRCFHIFL